MLGNNRPDSCDSHEWATSPGDPVVDPFVPQKNVIGEAEIIYWPLSRIRFLNESYETHRVI